MATSWTLGPVHQEPTKELHQWSVFEVPFDGPERPWTRHLVGVRPNGFKAQVSSSVELLDPVTRRAITRSGRVYELAHHSGINADVLAVWGAWKRRYGLEEEGDVTEEVERLLQGARS